jgi:hypothetical protein
METGEMKIRAIKSHKMQAASWHGQWYSEREERWLTICSAYGPIEYTTPEAARAAVCAHLESQQS